MLSGPGRCFGPRRSIRVLVACWPMDVANLEDLPPAVDGLITINSNLIFKGRFTIPNDLRVMGAVRAAEHLDVAGSLDVYGSVACLKSMAVAGDCHIRRLFTAGTSISVGGALKAMGHVVAGAWMRLGGPAQVAKTLRAGSELAAGDALWANGAVECGSRMVVKGQLEASWVWTPTCDVVCPKVVTKNLPLGRHYWAALPAFSNWRDQILDKKLCWDDWRRLPTSEERDVLARTSFGPSLLEGQVRNFLGVTESFSL